MATVMSMHWPEITKQQYEQVRGDVNWETNVPDGAKFRGPVELRKALLKRSDAFVFTLTQKLLTYGLGRGLDYYDAPAVRQIKRDAARSDYHFSSVIMGIVKSTPFQMSMAPTLAGSHEGGR